MPPKSPSAPPASSAPAGFRRLARFCLLTLAAGAAMAEEFATGYLPDDPAVYAPTPLAPRYRAWVPPEKDLSAWFPTPGQQGRQSSCSAWAIAYAARAYYAALGRGSPPARPDQRFSPVFVFNQIERDYLDQFRDALRGRGASAAVATPPPMPDDPRMATTTLSPRRATAHPPSRKPAIMLLLRLLPTLTLMTLALGVATEAQAAADRPIPQRQPVAPHAAPPADACDDCPEMVRLQGGTFMMGSPVSESERSSDERQHSVTVDGFAIGKYEVTQAEWRAVMGNNPSNFAGCDRCPVEQVSWNDVQQYLGKLKARTGRRYRLPTEAEWEYACRARGSETYCGADSPDPVAWYRGNSGDKTHPVGQKRANRFGLHDMSGNVWEWTCSAYTEGYEGDEKTGTNDAGSRRVDRGGSWDSGPDNGRSADRFGDDPTFRRDFLGFRLAQD